MTEVTNSRRSRPRPQALPLSRAGVLQYLPIGQESTSRFDTLGGMALELDFKRIRTLTITALFSDDLLFERLVLKGGNAISLVHGLSSRVSLDLDFSMEEGFEDLDEAHGRMERALRERFAPFEIEPLDVKLYRKPSVERADLPWWGGYVLEFKLVEAERRRTMGASLARLRREALAVGPAHLRVFQVEFSKGEYCQGKVRAELDDYTIFVYPPLMIAVEKLRAVCQQMEEYPHRGRTRSPRAQDFYDIHCLATREGLRFDSPETMDLTRAVFAAKEAPLRLLGLIGRQREFHRTGWPAVRDSAREEVESYDFYFDFVLKAVEPLHILWME